MDGAVQRHPFRLRLRLQPPPLLFGWASAPHQDALLQRHRQALLLDGQDEQVGGAGRGRGRGGGRGALVQLPSPPVPRPARVAQHRLHRRPTTPLGGLCRRAGGEGRSGVRFGSPCLALSLVTLRAGPRRPPRGRRRACAKHQGGGCAHPGRRTGAAPGAAALRVSEVRPTAPMTARERPCTPGPARQDAPVVAQWSHGPPCLEAGTQRKTTAPWTLVSGESGPGGGRASRLRAGELHSRTSSGFSLLATTSASSSVAAATPPPSRTLARQYQRRGAGALRSRTPPSDDVRPESVPASHNGAASMMPAGTTPTQGGRRPAEWLCRGQRRGRARRAFFDLPCLCSLRPFHLCATRRHVGSSPAVCPHTWTESQARPEGPHKGCSCASPSSAARHVAVSGQLAGPELQHRDVGLRVRAVCAVGAPRRAAAADVHAARLCALRHHHGARPAPRSRRDSALDMPAAVWRVALRQAGVQRVTLLSFPLRHCSCSPPASWAPSWSARRAPWCRPRSLLRRSPPRRSRGPARR